jgi:hypothetical protein
MRVDIVITAGADVHFFVSPARRPDPEEARNAISKDEDNASASPFETRLTALLRVRVECLAAIVERPACVNKAGASPALKL